jgi:FMN phosphatase YigB (HAD superfamily)
MGRRKRIGIDFDNTLIDYDAVFLVHARALRLVADDFCGTKDAVRTAVRGRPNGEQDWQRLQGLVYGGGIRDAVMFEGADAFLRRARAEGHEIVIVSHKTQFGHSDSAHIDLRAAARAWMSDKRFFSQDGFGIDPEKVLFETTRSEKIQRIAQLACTHFIDDLPEVLDDPKFPPGVTKLLFTNGARPDCGHRPDAFAHWGDIAVAVLR